MKSFPEFKDDVEFAKQLIMEQGVTCLPGSVSVDHLPAKYDACFYTPPPPNPFSPHTHSYTNYRFLAILMPFALLSSCPMTN